MLKKLTTIFCKAIVLSIFLVFVGCENLFNQNLIESQSTVSGERKDHLIELALTGNWKSSETEVENAILAILEKEGRSAETSSVKMSKIDEASIVVPGKLNPSRSAIVEECNEINFDLYSLETDDEELYAVTSDDKRVGNVLALVDSEFKSDISNIDGYYNMTCTATNGSNIITITDNFIHCNTGWGGSRNGYYLSGVMNFGMGPLTNDNADRSIEGTSYYYQYKLSQTNILKPKIM